MIALTLSLLLSIAAQAAEPVPTQEGVSYEIVRIGDLWLWDRYLGKEPIEVNVCANLQHAPERTDRSFRDFAFVTRDIATGKRPGDPYIEALLGPGKFIVSHPTARTLLEKVAERERRGAPLDTFHQLVFGSLATATALEIIQDRVRIGYLCDRSYLMLMLLRTLRQKPSWISAPGTAELCRELEAGFLVEPAPPTDEQRARLEQLMAAAGVSPAAIHYDPNLRSRVTLEWRGFGPILRVQWMLDVLAGRL